MEKLVLPLAHTVFLAKDMASLGEILQLSLDGIINDRVAVGDSSLWKGYINVFLSYTAKDNGAPSSAHLTLPWEENVPTEWLQIEPSNLQVSFQNSDFQVLLDNALEVTADICIKENQLPVAASAADEVNAADEANAASEANEANEASAADEASEAEAMPEVAAMPEDTAATNDQPTEAATEAATEDTDLAAVIAEEEAAELTAPIQEVVTKRPWATTETVGNEYRMKFYLVQMGEDLETIARKHQVSREAISRLNSVSDEQIKSGMILNIPD